MNVTYPNCVIILALLMTLAGNTHAGKLEETCCVVYKKLSSGPYESMTKSVESFTDDGKHYHGCVIRLSGNANKITKTQRPSSLFGESLPYCPDGMLPADLPPNMLNEDGWCGDRMADGPDGTFFRAIKKNVFCITEGRWDGGDDSDPKYIPSPRYEVIVKCASR